jgi:hypothetical protein
LLRVIREDFLGCGTFNLKDGPQIRFLEDTSWVGSKLLKEQFPNMYNIVYYPHITVTNVMNQMPLYISFRRDLMGVKLIAWKNLVAKIVKY